MMPLDAAVFVLGLVVTVAQMLAYVDSMAINTVTCLINVSIWIVLTKRDVKSRVPQGETRRIVNMLTVNGLAAGGRRRLS